MDTPPTIPGGRILGCFLPSFFGSFLAPFTQREPFGFIFFFLPFGFFFLLQRSFLGHHFFPCVPYFMFFFSIVFIGREGEKLFVHPSHLHLYSSDYCHHETPEGMSFASQSPEFEMAGTLAGDLGVITLGRSKSGGVNWQLTTEQESKKQSIRLKPKAIQPPARRSLVPKTMHLLAAACVSSHFPCSTNSK